MFTISRRKTIERISKTSLPGNLLRDFDFHFRGSKTRATRFHPISMNPHKLLSPKYVRERADRDVAGRKSGAKSVYSTSSTCHSCFIVKFWTTIHHPFVQHGFNPFSCVRCAAVYPGPCGEIIDGVSVFYGNRKTSRGPDGGRTQTTKIIKKKNKNVEINRKKTKKKKSFVNSFLPLIIPLWAPFGSISILNTVA